MDTTDTTPDVTTTMSIQVPGGLQLQLDALARATGRSRQEVALEALQRYIEADAAYVALVEERRQEARAGLFATPERVDMIRTKYQAEHTD